MTAFLRVTDDGNLEGLLEQVDRELRRGLVRKALRAGLEPVKRVAKELAPRSKETGTREGWSAKTKAERDGVKEHADTIGIVVRDYDDGWFVAVVGPQYPAGALAHLIEAGHRKVLWGVVTGDVVTGKPFLEPAADRTKEEQLQAVVDTITAGVHEIIARG